MTAENADRAGLSVKDGPGLSTKRRSQALMILRSKFRVIMKKKHIKFHNFRIMLVQIILSHEPVKRLKFSQNSLNIIEDYFCNDHHLLLYMISSGLHC